MSDYRIFETAEFQGRLASLPPEEADYVRDRLHERVYPRLRGAGDSSSSAQRGASRTVAPSDASNGRFRLFYRIDHEEHIVYLLTFKRRELDELDEEMLEALSDAPAPVFEPGPESPPESLGEAAPAKEPHDLPPFKPPEDFSPFAR